MALPKIQHPLFDCEIPSLKKKVKFRPMLVKEEKILLMAKQSNEKSDQINSIKQVCNNCIQDKVDIDQLPLFDIEYLFTKIRAASISNKVKVSYKDNEDEKVYSFDIDLDKVEVKFPEGVESKLEVGDSIYLTLKYPPVSLYTNSEFFNLDDTKIFETVVQASMDKIYEGDKLYDCKQQTKEELQEFIDSIPAKQFEQIQNFLTNIPSLFYEIKYSNSKGTERVIQLQTLEDFFTFG